MPTVPNKGEDYVDPASALMAATDPLTRQSDQMVAAMPAISAFMRGGIHGMLKAADLPTPAWSDKIADIIHSPAFNDALGALPIGTVLGPKLEKGAEGFATHALVDKSGKKVGLVEFSGTESNKLNVEWIRGDPEGSSAGRSGSLGFREMRELFNSIKEQYPNAKVLSGERVTGARGQSSDWLTMPTTTMRLRRE
jgi:hypothetical protein